MLGTSDTCSMIHLSQRTSEPSYYIIDCWISIKTFEKVACYNSQQKSHKKETRNLFKCLQCPTFPLFYKTWTSFLAICTTPGLGILFSRNHFSKITLVETMLPKTLLAETMQLPEIETIHAVAAKVWLDGRAFHSSADDDKAQFYSKFTC